MEDVNAGVYLKDAVDFEEDPRSRHCWVPIGSNPTRGVHSGLVRQNVIGAVNPEPDQFVRAGSQTRFQVESVIRPAQFRYVCPVIRATFIIFVKTCLGYSQSKGMLLIRAMPTNQSGTSTT